MLGYRNILWVGFDPHKRMRTKKQELRSSHHTIQKDLDGVGKGRDQLAVIEKSCQS